MKKAAMQEKKAPEIARVANYHEMDTYASYAFQGFKARKYFSSDRAIALDENFRRADGQALKGYGLEIETECYGIGNISVYAELLDKIILAQFPPDLFKLQHDGSLNGDVSAEIISQPMTREFIRNHYADYKLMYDHYFPAFRIKCGESCGMHTNISLACFGATEEAVRESLRKLGYLVNHNFRLFCVATLRNTDRTGYCQRMPNLADKETARRFIPEETDSSHGVAINYGHYSDGSGRVELRFIGGQPSYGGFRNTMEVIFHVVDACRRLPWEQLDDMAAVFNGCNGYVYDRLATVVYRDSRRQARPYFTEETLSKIHASVKPVQYL